MPEHSLREKIKQKLFAALAPSHLEIKDDSATHVGHAGARAGGESHFSVQIVSTSFVGLALAARHRLIYAALADEMSGKIHALRIEAITPDEYNQKQSCIPPSTLRCGH